MVEILELKLTPNHLIALGILGMAKEPVHYKTFLMINPEVFGAVVDLKDKGLASETQDGIVHPLDQEENHYYELTNKGRGYLDRIMKT